LAEARGRKSKDHKNGSVNFKAAWYDDFDYGSGRLGLMAYFLKKFQNVDH
jgi:hypothetical protein